jgi:hypothetical protein
MRTDRADFLARAHRQIHTPESFGRAVIDTALQAAAEHGDDVLEARISIATADDDGSVPICFFLFGQEICISVPVA